jgi:hypothetical protein
MNISPLLLWKLTVAAATNSALLFKDEFGSRILLPKSDHYLPKEHNSQCSYLLIFIENLNLVRQYLQLLRSEPLLNKLLNLGYLDVNQTP